MKEGNLSIYKIKKGDTLNSIASRYNTNPTQILVENAIVPRQIREGFVLVIKQK